MHVAHPLSVPPSEALAGIELADSGCSSSNQVRVMLQAPSRKQERPIHVDTQTLRRVWDSSRT